MPISSYPGFPLHLCSPPSWDLPPRPLHLCSPPSRVLPVPLPQVDRSQRRLVRINRKKIPVRRRQKSTQQFEPETHTSETHTSETHAVSADGRNTTGTPTTVNALNNLAEQGPCPDILREDIVHSVSRAYITSINQNNRSDSSTIKFEGLDIKPSLVPNIAKDLDKARKHHRK
ncbi:hypothetical protein SOVF_062760 [Spinacia oleracea]|uniref:Uncharacterized protein n=1 Tax=Spinacia oleracea TaxID=3562 RepID=A0ABM3QMP3_SPIOL|nr:uncharacterized protein LOC110782510 [Spinacia oleracea]KNA19293.1 hypothetical protein SOVF_062760 [Spinacia oleracea]